MFAGGAMRHQIDGVWPNGILPAVIGMSSSHSIPAGSGEDDTLATLRAWLEQFSRGMRFQGARYIHLGHRRPGAEGPEPAPMRFFSTLGEEDDPWRAGDPAAPRIDRSFVPFVWSTRDNLELPDVQRSWLSVERRRGFHIGIAVPVQDYHAGPAYLSLLGGNGSVAFGIASTACDALIGAAIDFHCRALAAITPASAPSETAILSERELSCLRQAATGATISQTAASLGIAHRTVELYVSRATSKLGALNKLHAVAIAVSSGLIQI